MQTPENKKISNKKYRDSHKEEARVYSKEYNLKNNEKLKQQKRDNYWKDIEKTRKQRKEKYWKTHTPYVTKWEKLRLRKKEYKKLLDRQYYHTHKEETKQKAHERYLKNQDSVKEKTKQYKVDHPEVKLASDLKSLTKLGFPLKLPPKQYKYALHAWSKTVKKLGHGLCQICPNPATVSHHIIHKAKYPGLSLNVNNGIPLCDTCHYESHGWN